MGMNFSFYMNQLIHECFIDMKTTGCINNDNIPQMADRIRNSVFGNLDGVFAAFFRIYRYVQFLPQNLELCNCRRTIYVTGNHQRTFALAFQLFGKFCRCRRFTCALQPDQHNNGWRFGGNRNTALRTAQQFGQFIANDFDDRLGCVQAAEYFFANSFFPYAFDKIFGYGKIDICFEQCTPHLFEGFTYIFF